MAPRRRTAAQLAERAATEWRAAAYAQRTATCEHGEFYSLAAELVDTLRVLESLATALARQVDQYGVGRDLYDDSGTVDARERLDLAVGALQDLASGLGQAERHASRFHSEIGHIGVRLTTCGDQR